MNEIFNFNGKAVRTVTVDNEPYFVGKDVAEILGYSGTAKAIRTHHGNTFFSSWNTERINSVVALAIPNSVEPLPANT